MKGTQVTIWALSLISVGVQGVSLTMDPNLALAIVQCTTSSELNPGVIQTVMGGQNVEDNRFKDFLVCLYNKLGILDNNGALNFWNLQNVLFNERNVPNRFVAGEAVQRCGNVQGFDIQDVIYELDKCFRDVFSEHRIKFI